MKIDVPTFVVSRIAVAMVFISSFVFPACAQQCYTYLFSESPFTSHPPGGPSLEPVGTLTPRSVTIPASTCADEPTLDLTHFESNSGFRAKAFFTGRYSIEMIFKFDELSSYARIIDFSNGTSDNGIYTHDDCLNFYPSGSIGMCPGAFDTVNYKQIVITRDDATKAMNVYVNGTLFTTYIDLNDYYVIGAVPNDSMKFFIDDLLVPNEASSGNVALIRTCDFVLSSADVITSYNNFCSRLTATADLTNNIAFNVFPNPASGQINIQVDGIDFTKKIQLTIMNTLGQRKIQMSIKDKFTSLTLDDAWTGLFYYQLLIDNIPVKGGKVIFQ